LAEGKIFKSSMFGYSKKEVLDFLNELNEEQKKANEKSGMDISRLEKEMKELTLQLDSLKEENEELKTQLEERKVTPQVVEVQEIKADAELEKIDFSVKNSELYCELLKEIEDLRREKETAVNQYEEAIAEIRRNYEKQLEEKNDEIYQRRQKYFSAVLEHIQYKRSVTQIIDELKKKISDDTSI